MIFGQLHSDIFRPLASANRHIYQDILVFLYDMFFDEDAPDVYPTKESVQQEIEERLARMARLEWVAEEDDDSAPVNTVSLAARILRRLLLTGWLDEDRDGYDKPFLTMPPAVALLLRSLIEIQQDQKTHYGGTVLNILTLVESAIANPEERAINIHSAMLETKRFSMHLNAMFYGLRTIQQYIFASRAPQDILKTFFEDFVDKILVADWKTLKTRNNPFRFRTQIIRILSDLQHDHPRKHQIAKGYQEQFSYGDKEAEHKLELHIDSMIKVFTSIDRILARIEAHRTKLEVRVTDTIRYMDTSNPGVIDRIVALAGELALIDEQDAVAVKRIIPKGLSAIAPMDGRSVHAPRKQRVPLESQPLQSHTVSIEKAVERVAVRNFIMRRMVSPGKVMDYLERNMMDRHQMSAEDFVIETIEDYVAFTAIRRLHHLDPHNSHRSRRFAVTRCDDYVETPWIKCRRFVVEKK